MLAAVATTAVATLPIPLLPEDDVIPVGDGAGTTKGVGGGGGGSGGKGNGLIGKKVSIFCGESFPAAKKGCINRTKYVKNDATTYEAEYAGAIEKNEITENKNKKEGRW